MPIVGALEGWDQQALSNQQQQDNAQKIQMNALTIAGTQQAQAHDQQQQAALQDAARYAQGDGTATPPAGALQQATPDGGSQPDAGNAPAATKPNMGQVDYNTKMAERLAQLGQPTMANAAWNAASTARDDALKQASLTNSTLVGNLNNVIKQADTIGQYMSGVTDQNSYDSAIHAMAAAGMPQQEVQLLANKPYDPAYVQGLVSHAISAKDAATQKLNAVKFQATQDYHQQELDQRQSLETQREAAQAGREAARVRSEKTGKPVGSPTTQDLVVSEQAINNSLPGIDTATVDSLKPDVAARAKALVAQNKGMDMSTASYRAIQELKDSGQLTQNTTNTKTFMSPLAGEDKTDTKYTVKGNTPKDALPDPGTVQDRIVGKYYNVNGQVRQWLGTGGGQ